LIKAKGQVLGNEFYDRDDVITIAKELLGKVLVTNINNVYTSGIITEVEAYKAPEDKASHAYNNRRTPRTEIMFRHGGHAYVYLCYGIHHLFNVVTGPEDSAHAILIRAIEPIDNIEEMMSRRKQTNLHTRLSSGPGTLTLALGINRHHSGTNMLAGKTDIWIEDRQIYYEEDQIVSTSRIGIDYAEEWKDKPWRFYIKDSKWISKR
jgi:DNA-3-methyladenine glycosylase